MRILFGVESYYPNISGVVVFVKRAANYLTLNGHEAVILTTNPGNLPEREDGDGVLVFRLKGQKNPFRKNLRVSSIFNHFKVKEILRETKPDIVHLQDLGPLNYLIFHEAKRAGIPIVAHHHFSVGFVLGYFRRMTGLHWLVESFIKSIGKNFYNRCHLVITPTEFARNELLSWGVKTPVIVISNGVETDRFKPGNVGAGRKIVLYVGRIDKDKNIETLAKAVPLVLEAVPEAEFWFVGDGADRRRVQRMLQKEEGAGRVIFSGFIPREGEKFIKIYQSASLLWIASLETQSIVALEGMAAGLPIVGANVGALPELVFDKVNGFLVNMSDAAGFARAAAKILNDEVLAKKFGAASVKIASTHSIEGSMEKIIGAYERVRVSTED